MEGLFSDHFMPVSDSPCWKNESDPVHWKTLQSIFPSKFQSYVRICHPAWLNEALEPDDHERRNRAAAGFVNLDKIRPISWEYVATKHQKEPDRLMTWQSICAESPPSIAEAGISPPFEGELTETQLMLIMDRLSHLPCYLGELDQRLVRISEPKAHQMPEIWLLYHPRLRTQLRIRKFVDQLTEGFERLRPVIEGSGLVSDP